MTSRAYEELEHTADLRLHVTGADLPALFSHAAQGLRALLRCRSGERAQPVCRRIALQAPDLETLLVDWLNELLYVVERHNEAYAGFALALRDERRLEATALGWSDQHLGRSIKAATYHGLQVQRTAEGYEATITLDV